MKLAILSPFYPYRGGIAQFSDRLLTELENSCEVKAFSYTTLYPQILFPGKSQEVPSPNSKKEKSIKSLSSINPFSAIKTARIINKYNPDVLVIAYWMFFFAPILFLLSCFLNKRIKIVGLVHNAIAHERSLFDKPLAKLFFRRCDAFVCMSESVKNDILDIYSEANILVNEHPIYDHYGDKISKEKASSELGLIGGKRTLLFFGLIREYKGLDLLIKATSFLDSDYQLLIVGENYGNFKPYQDLIDQSPIKENIRVFQEYIPDDRVGLFFSASDLLILPYKSATQSGVLTITYHFNTPVVVTDVGGLAQPVRDNRIGLIVEELTPIALADAIQSYFKVDSEYYIRNIEAAKDKLSWRTYTKKFLDFLTES